MNRDYEVAIFDMDGTLLDSMRYWRYTSLEFLLAHQMPVRPEDLARMHDTSSRKLLYEIAEREGIQIGDRKTVIAELESYMNRHYLHDVHLKENVPELLEAIRKSGMRMCVATGSPRQYARNGLYRLGILDYFEFVTDNYENAEGLSKDKPEYFTLLAKRLGVAPEKCVVFEDALYAMEAAKAAGCGIVAIEDETARNQREGIVKIADRYIRGYAELLNK